MSEASDQLNADADALDRTAAAAEWIAGLNEDEVEKARVQGEAQILRNWAGLCRVIAEQNA